MTLALRDYQEAAVGNIRAALREHARILFVGPCGMGKTQLFVFMAKSAASRGNRIYILVHRRELIRQTSQTLDAWAVRHGIIAPGNSMTADLVQVASVATLGRRLARAPRPALIVVDEAHHAISPTYRAILDAYPEAKVLGVTASPERMDGKGLGDAFETMVIGPGVAELIEGGWLSRFDYFAPPQRVDLSSVKTRLGDYAIDDLAVAIDRATITGDCIQHLRDLAPTRQAIVFCVSVDHARHVAEGFRAAGFRAAAVDGSMNMGDRDRAIAGLKSGSLQVVTSCSLISEGFDCPAVGAVVLLRPTKSLALHIQMVGRALRPKPDGGPALILDHVGNIYRHGQPDEPRAWSLEGRTKRAAPAIRTCRACYRTFGAGQGVDCEEPPTECPMRAAAEAAAKAPPEVVDGRLEAITGAAVWARGIDLVAARGGDWFRLLGLADTEEKLRQIARARGYRAGWIRHVLRERAERRRAA